KQSEADAVVEVDSQPGKQQFPAASLAIVALDSRELDQVAERVAAEEPGPVGDRRPIVGLVAGVSQPLPGLVEVVHVTAEVPSPAPVRLERSAVPGRPRLSTRPAPRSVYVAARSPSGPAPPHRNGARRLDGRPDMATRHAEVRGVS